MSDKKTKNSIPSSNTTEDAKPKNRFAKAIAQAKPVTLPAELSELRYRPDRIGKYFKKYLSKFVFVEFGDEFLKGTKIESFMRGVPVPLRKKDVGEFAGGKGLMPNHIAENMTWVMGSDPQFKYDDAYIQYMLKMFNKNIVEQILKEGRNAAEIQDYDNACIHFRACLCVNPTYLHSMYSYAKVCRSMYEKSNNKEYIGRFKAESMDYFELLTELHPRFAQAYYYLGYAYLNMGLYAKAEATWRLFLKTSRISKDMKEIKNRIAQIKEPIRIEEGYTLILSGGYEDGIDILEPFLERKYKDWWPLHYYLGVAYLQMGRTGEAVARFKNVLAMNGSHLETMEELLAIYKSQGDKENITKFETKIKLIRADLERESKEMDEYVDEERHSDESSALDAPLSKTQKPAPKKKGEKAAPKEKIETPPKAETGSKKIKRLK
jgi:tetratricopeptide (TPR) repeat protein